MSEPKFKVGDRVVPKPLCPSCCASDNNPYVDASGKRMRACGRCMIQWEDSAAPSPDDAALREKAKDKPSHVGAPAIFKLEEGCQQINDAFGDEGFGCYLVGSALDRPDWRDVDVRFIMPDDKFAAMFPDAGLQASFWEFDPRWLLLTTAISDRLSKQSGLPVDFQFQAQTFANERHAKNRSAIGLRIAKSEAVERDREERAK